MGIPDHLICFLRNLHAGQEAAVRTGHGTTDWFQIGKGVHQGCMLSPCLFNLYAEYIMRNAGLVFPSLEEFSTVCCGHTVKGFGIVSKAVDIFLELPCFFDDPTDVGSLISGSSAFSKSSLNIWKFMVHVLLKPGLENSEHYFTSMCNECNCAVV